MECRSVIDVDLEDEANILFRGDFGTQLRQGILSSHGFRDAKKPATFVCLRVSHDTELLWNREIEGVRVDSHPNIHYYFSCAEVQGWRIIAAERIQCTLTQAFERNDKFKVQLKVKDVWRQLTQGVKHLHEHHILHRNINPDNIYVDNSGTIVKISGFGLCKKIVGDSVSFSGTKAECWSPHEMLVENPGVNSRITRKVDIFSLGCVFFFVEREGTRLFSDPSQIIANRSLLVKNQKLCKQKPSECYLIKQMTEFAHEDRPDIYEVELNVALKDGDYYLLYSKDFSPGLCIIINQVQFTSSTYMDRFGSDKDRDRLKQTFQKFGLEVELHNNLTKAQMEGVFDNLKKIDANKYGSMFICILSHGDGDGLCGVDGLKFCTRDYIGKLTGIFPQKPKVLITQACRGKKVQGAELDLPNRAAGLVVSDSANSPTESQQEPQDFCIEVKAPGLSDYLELHATIDGYEAYLNKEDGSVYIKQLCEKLDSEGHEKDLDSLFRDVRQEMTSWFGLIDGKAVQQVPERNRDTTVKLIQLQRVQ